MASKIQEGEQSKYNTTLDILQHMNHLLFFSDLESMNTNKQAHYKRWRILQTIHRTIKPYMTKSEREKTNEFTKKFTFPNISGNEWVRSGAENRTRNNLDEFENQLRGVMSRAGFHIREREDLDDW